MQPTRLRAIELGFVAVIALEMTLMILAMFNVSVSTSLAGIRISSRTLFRPFVLTVATVIAYLHVCTYRQQDLMRARAVVRRHAIFFAVCLSVLAFMLAIRVSAFEANAADQYGYISQASLWARGQLTTYEPLATVAPWRDATWTFSPLGYRPGPLPGTIVPSYPPGLPIVMA